MNIKSLIARAFATAILLTQGSAIAGIGDEARAALQSIVKDKFSVLSEIDGDLNNDGLTDWVGHVKIERSNRETQSIYVLTRKNGLQLSVVSKEVQYYDFGGNTSTEVLKIANNAFHVCQSTRGHWGAAGSCTQFKHYKGQWQAIGYSDTRVSFNPYQSETTEGNLLTGKYKSVIDFEAINKKPKQKIKSGFQKKITKMLLKNFDLGQQ